MSSSSAVSNNLRAVLICVRTRSGARIVLSVPSDADPNIIQPALRHDEETLSRNDNRSLPISKNLADELKTNGTDQASSHSAASPGANLGIKTEILEKLLTPGRWCDGRKFEITVDSLTFVGKPCYAHENGTWSTDAPEDEQVEETHFERPHAIEIREPEQQARDFTHAADSFDSGLSGQSLGTSLESVSTRSGGIADGLLMFHVVFVMRDRLSGSSKTTLGSGDVYEHLCEPLTAALKHLQEQYRFVEVESRKIFSARSKPNNLQAGQSEAEQAVLYSSELAWAIQTIYDAVSVNDIATVRLHGIELALQIPDASLQLPLHASALYSALLLLEDKSVLLRSLESRTDAAAMSFFITHLVPTKPLSKMASKLALPPSAVLFLAEHLIRWRKARLIPPLHARNSYVINPSAPLDQLSALSNDYGKKFPALLSLQTMLSMLGPGKPVVFASCFPSRVHRDAFMEILAWLVCKGLVIRMNTAGWLKLHLPAEDAAVSSESDGELDDNSSTISDSGTAFRPDEPQALYTEATRILDPSDLGQPERRAVLTLRRSLQDSELQETFTKLLRHFDGEHAFEDIAIIEGLKRSKVEECLSKLDSLEALQKFQYP